MRVGRHFLRWLCGLAGGLLVLPAAIAADVYRFVDASGAVHFSDSPVDVRFELVALTPVGLRVGGRSSRRVRRPPA